MAHITKNVKKIPKTPGVYFFRDKSGKFLYIGKAANLKNRLKSYFDKSQKNFRLQKMLETAESVGWQKIDSEIEALILESRLIKKHRPPFNIMLRDDKQYFFVEFSKDIFPKVIITHRPTGFPELKFPNKPRLQNSKISKSKKPAPTSYNLKPDFVGPFTDGTALKITLKLLRQVFPYCTCRQKHNNYCLNYHLGNCPGFCCLKESKIKNKNKKIREYRKNIKAIKEVLKGERASLIKRFEKELNTLAKKEKFEQAIEMRDKIGKLKKIFENVRVITALKYLDVSENQNNKEGALEKLKRSLGLKNLPRRIEGYDVSNIQGKFATGAMVVFTDGKPDKSEYRKFKIQAAGGDTGMLSEILTRRFGHPEWQWPDLILIDGGRDQLNAAYSVISRHRKSYGRAMSTSPIPIIALTKDAKHKGHHIYACLVRSSPPQRSFGPRLRTGETSNGALPLRNLPPAARNLIIQIDQESHRFAIQYYRRLHRKELETPKFTPY
jgi:excinuclease ABC subunit C